MPTAFANGSGPSIRFGGWFDESWTEITDVLRQAGISTPDAFSEGDGQSNKLPLANNLMPRGARLASEPQSGRNLLILLMLFWAWECRHRTLGLDQLSGITKNRGRFVKVAFLEARLLVFPFATICENASYGPSTQPLGRLWLSGGVRSRRADHVRWLVLIRTRWVCVDRSAYSNSHCEVSRDRRRHRWL